ncbi:transglutaminase, partial [Klebsiella pneumoniae]
HCRAEFHAAGQGWIPVDPADVRKAVLEENLPLTDPKIVALRAALFGSWEMNWVAFNSARDFVLPPGAADAPINYFMYPEGMTPGGALDGMDPDGF